MKQSRKPDLNQLLTFERVARSGSFTAAARALQLPKSTVSLQIRALEARLGTRLLQRTTRRVALTEAGKIYLSYCERVIAEAEDADQALLSYTGEPRGLLRAGVPATFARVFLSPILPEFCRKYPLIQLEFLIPGGRVDPVEHLLDVVIRIGPMADSSYVIRKLGEFPRGLFASGAYLRRSGRPVAPRDLAAHSIISTSRTQQGGQLRLRNRGGQEEEARFDPRVSVPDPSIAHQLAVCGTGIAVIPEFLARGTPRLQRVLPEWTPPPVEVCAVYPARQLVPAKLTVFLNEVEAGLRNGRGKR